MAALWVKMNLPPFLAYLNSSSSLDYLLGALSSRERQVSLYPTFVQRSSKSTPSRIFLNSLVPISPSSYTHDVTEFEFNSLNPRSQEQLKRSAATNLQASQPPAQQWGYYTPAAQPERLRRVGMFLDCFLPNSYLFKHFFADWLRDRVYFEGLSKDDNYARQRLGYRAPNIFVMDLTS